MLIFVGDWENLITMRIEKEQLLLKKKEKKKKKWDTILGTEEI